MISRARLLDRMEYMEGIPTKYHSHAIIDAEYGIGESGKHAKNRYRLFTNTGHRVRQKESTDYTVKNWDNSIPDASFWKEIFRVSHDQFIFGANYYPEIVGTPFKPLRRDKYQEFLEKNPTNWIIWDKVNGDSDFSDCEMIWTSIPVLSHVFYFMWNGMMQGRSISEGHIMQGNKSLNEARIHPTQKPVLVYKYLFGKLISSGPKASIYDPCLGSGSSRIAAHDLGFDFIGTEKDSEYFGKHEQRWKKYLSEYNELKKQQSIF